MKNALIVAINSEKCTFHVYEVALASHKMPFKRLKKWEINRPNSHTSNKY